MGNRGTSLQSTVGKKLTRNIYSEGGTLLVPAATIVANEHIKIMEKHGIFLTQRDVVPIGPYTTNHHKDDSTIDEAVLQVNQLFGEIRENRKVPLAEIGQVVIPMIHEIVHDTLLIDLFISLQSKDDYTYRHNIAVGALSHLIAKWMGLSHQEISQVTTAALLHDVGKMLIPEEILNKPDRLTEEEYALIKNHTVFGYEILNQTVGIIHRQALVALQHHERLDGGGYPFGVTAKKIDLYSRIVSVADVFHAMTSKRVYRDPLPFNQVLQQMEQDSFGVLDPAITRLFIERIMNSLIGNHVLLTDGRKGTIRSIPVHDPTRPFVQVEAEFVDLSKDLQVQIEQIV